MQRDFKLPKYWEGRTPPEEYFASVDYNDPPVCPFNLPALSRYARRVGKEIRDLRYDEVEQFRVVGKK